MIDWERVQELKDEVGAEDFDEVVDLFLEEVEENLTSLTPTLAPKDMEEVLHALRGSALNLGFGVFAEICQKGETTAAAGSIQGIDTREVSNVYHSSKTEFLTLFV